MTKRYLDQGICGLTGDFSEIEVVATNFNWRQSGGTTAVVQLVPEQAKTLKIEALGFDLPERVPRMRWRDVPKLLRRPANRPFRIYHCRRNNEMIARPAVARRARAPLRVIFNSAGQRRHKAFTRWMLRRVDAVIATSERSGSYLEVPYTVVSHGTDSTTITRRARGPTTTPQPACPANTPSAAPGAFVTRRARICLSRRWCGCCRNIRIGPPSSPVAPRPTTSPSSAS